MAFGELDTSILVIVELGRTAFERSVVETTLKVLHKTAMKIPCCSSSTSPDSLLSFQEHSAPEMLVEIHFSAARSGVEVLVARYFGSDLRKYLSNVINTPLLYCDPDID